MIYVIILSDAVCFCIDADASCGAGFGLFLAGIVQKYN